MIVFLDRPSSFISLGNSFRIVLFHLNTNMIWRELGRVVAVTKDLDHSIDHNNREDAAVNNG